MGYDTIQVRLKDAASQNSVAMQLREDDVRDKSVKQVMDYVLSNASGQYREQADIIKAQLSGRKAGVYAGRDPRPIAVGDPISPSIREVEKNGQKMGEIELQVSETELIG